MEKEKKKRTSRRAEGRAISGTEAAESGSVIENPAMAAEKHQETVSEVPVKNTETPSKTPEITPEITPEGKIADHSSETPETASEEVSEPSMEEASTVLEVPDLASKSPVQETKPAVAGSIMESPMVQLEREFRQRARVIREQMQNIQNSFVTIGFQLHWIKNHNMFRVMGYKNIYEYAEKECGIGRASCSNLINIIENFAERDEHGQVIESISECYRNYSSSQLVAMMGMPESMKQQVTPDMSVRSINKMRKGIPDKQAEEAATGKTAGAEAESPANAEAAGEDPETVRHEAEAQEPEEQEIEEQGTDPERESMPEQGSKKPVEEKDAEPPAATEESPFTEPDAGKAGDSKTSTAESVPAEEENTQNKEETASPAEAELEQEAEEEKKPEAASTLFTFDSYSTYHKAKKKVNELMEKVFSGNSPVTVKIVCVQGGTDAAVLRRPV